MMSALSSPAALGGLIDLKLSSSAKRRAFSPAAARMVVIQRRAVVRMSLEGAGADSMRCVRGIPRHREDIVSEISV